MLPPHLVGEVLGPPQEQANGTISTTNRGRGGSLVSARSTASSLAGQEEDASMERGPAGITGTVATEAEPRAVPGMSDEAPSACLRPSL